MDNLKKKLNSRNESEYYLQRTIILHNRYREHHVWSIENDKKHSNPLKNLKLFSQNSFVVKQQKGYELKNKHNVLDDEHDVKIAKKGSLIP